MNSTAGALVLMLTAPRAVASATGFGGVELAPIVRDLDRGRRVDGLLGLQFVAPALGKSDVSQAALDDLAHRVEPRMEGAVLDAVEFLGDLDLHGPTLRTVERKRAAEAARSFTSTSRH